MSKNKNQIIVTMLCAVLFAHLSKAEFEIPESSVFVPHNVGKVSVSHNENGFHVRQNNECHKVKNYDVDPVLRNIPSEKLDAFLKHGYLHLKKMNNNDYSLEAKVRGNGGGPITGTILYWTTKITGYSVVTATAAVGVTTTAPAVTAAIGAGVVAGGCVPMSGLASGTAIAAIAMVESASNVAYEIGNNLPLP